MGLALDTIGGFATNPGGTLTAITTSTGDSLTVRSFQFANPAYLEEIFRQGAAAGVVRVRSPRLHDNVQGIRLRALAADPSPLLGREMQQLLYPQDQLIVEITGGGAETDVVALLNYYADLPGVNAQLQSWAQVKPQIVNLVGQEVAVTTNATAGQWASAAINSAFDNLKANTPYAVLGYEVDTAVCAVGVQGPDLGNLTASGPGTTTRIETRDWFCKLSDDTGLPMVPVFNSANKGSTLVRLLSSATGQATNVNLILGQLPPLQGS